MFFSTTLTNLNQAGVWFTINGLMPQTVMHALGPFMPCAGLAADIKAGGTLSTRGPVSIPGGTYPGFNYPAFTASQVFLTSFDPTQNNAAFTNGVLHLGGDPKLVGLGEIYPQDIWPSGQTGCYATHRHNIVYPYQSGDIDGCNRWLIFVAWCSSANATANDWLNWEQGVGECLFEAETEHVPK